MDELSYRFATKEYVQARIAEAMNMAGGGSSATLGQKTITANGTYAAAADGLDGFDQVIVNVSAIGPDGLVNGSIVSTLWSGTVTDHNKLNGFTSTGTYQYVYLPLSNPIHVVPGDTITTKISVLSGSSSFCGYGIMCGNQLIEHNNTSVDATQTFSITEECDITMFTIMSRAGEWTNVYATLTISKNGVVVF